MTCHVEPRAAVVEALGEHFHPYPLNLQNGVLFVVAFLIVTSLIKA